MTTRDLNLARIVMSFPIEIVACSFCACTHGSLDEQYSSYFCRVTRYQYRRQCRMCRQNLALHGEGMSNVLLVFVVPSDALSARFWTAPNQIHINRSPSSTINGIMPSTFNCLSCHRSQYQIFETLDAIFPLSF